ncbi:MAG: NAD(P)-binding domain-containing protein [Proteobacteria bacterium]|nr:NAD(P)-binding domain-containing protein [Pseudomonadota bacterium]
MSANTLPVVIIGAGPVGLAAALHVRSRGLVPIVLEAGPSVGTGMRQWGHVRMFSPWEYNIDKLAGALLASHGWVAPDLMRFPTGREVVEAYLEPLAATPELKPQILFDARVIAVTKERHDRMKNAQRVGTPFLVRYLDRGEEREIRARTVIDASGTIQSPNPAGGAGIPALGELTAGDRIAYGIPDVYGDARARYAGKRVLVVGSGHSAFNVLGDLSKLRGEAPGTEIHWAVRRPSLRRVLGGGENDQLKERGQLGMHIAELVANNVIAVHTNIYVDRIDRTAHGLIARSGETTLPPIDEIVASTGFRPDFSILDEVRLNLDPGTQSAAALAPLIDPNLHSCGTVRPHGAVELKHPDADLYVVGMKSYGRAPTFLLLTGYEQVRSIAAAIAGDWESARRVELVLPETGVCSTQFADEDNTAQATSCCGGPAPAEANACCVADADAKAAGEAGCGCATEEPDQVIAIAPAAIPPKTSCCGSSRSA